MVSCGFCCGGFSLFGVLFLAIVSRMIDDNSLLIEIADKDRISAVENCRIGIAVYALFTVLSVGCILTGALQKSKVRNEQAPLIITDI